MNFVMIGKPKTIIDIKENNKFNIAIGKKRDSFNILVIDDEEFEKEHDLRKLGYKISVMSDLNNVIDVEKYDIVLCDIKGVGKKLFGINGDGCMLIEEIRKHYPAKYLIAFSGETYNVDKNKYFSMADDWITKAESDIDKWTNLLDNAFLDLLNSFHYWSRIRSSLLNNNVSIIDVLRLEDSFANSILSGKSEFPPKKIKINFDSVTWQMLINVASTAAYNILIRGRL